MHLAYFDETGIDGYSSVVMFGALIVPTGTFGAASVMHHNAIRQILPTGNLDDFQEFHASALYHGKKPFEGFDEPKRFLAILTLLAAVRAENCLSSMRRLIVGGSQRPIHRRLGRASLYMLLFICACWGSKSGRQRIILVRIPHQIRSFWTGKTLIYAS